VRRDYNYYIIERRGVMATRGQPKKFDSDQLISLWREYCDEICDEGFKNVPTQTAFCRWLNHRYEKTDRKTIYNSLNKYFPEIKKEFDKIQSDVFATGGMLGRYNPTMTIFALKNWCAWTDKAETTVDSKITVEMSDELEEWSE
jgi:hypothetical protein